MDKTERSLVGENTFGDDLEDNLPEKSSRRVVSYVYGDDYTAANNDHVTTDYNPVKRLAEIEGTYNLVPPNHNVTVEVTFRYKPPHSSEFFANSKFIVWRDRSVMPNVYYWERKQGDAPNSPYKYGPFKEISAAFEGINDVFGVTTANIERII